ncbi:hypothetical protein ASD64_06875 [Mesorhizobium sp. Root157]|nr:hypothetical protein ASD64_06875 [Mesorhizobium sp. Root157]
MFVSSWDEWIGDAFYDSDASADFSIKKFMKNHSKADFFRWLDFQTRCKRLLPSLHTFHGQ